MSNPTRPGPAQPAPVTGPGPSSWPIPTTPAFGAPVVPGSASTYSHFPAGATPTLVSNMPPPATATLPAFLAAGAAEAASNARGQQLIDSVKNRSNVDTTPSPSGPWPLKR